MTVYDGNRLCLKTNRSRRILRWKSKHSSGVFTVFTPPNSRVACRQVFFFHKLVIQVNLILNSDSLNELRELFMQSPLFENKVAIDFQLAFCF